MKIKNLLILFGIFFMCFALNLKAESNNSKKAQKLFKKGNFKEALQILKSVLIDEPVLNGANPKNITEAYKCYAKLQNWHEIDDFLLKVEQNNPKNFKALQELARIYRIIPHYGYLVDNEFQRARHRARGAYSQTREKDALRSMQLMLKGMRVILEDDLDLSNGKGAGFFLNFAVFLKGNNYYRNFSFSLLTDLNEKVDYKKAGVYLSGGNKAEVDDKGLPVYYSTPKSWQSAKNNGERWRWLLAQASKNSKLRAQAKFELAEHLHIFFGVQTLKKYFYRGWYASKNDNDANERKEGILSLHTLEENETIAHLASGVKRFKMPEEFNFIKIFKNLIEQDNEYYKNKALLKLAEIFENRRQLKKAAEFWQKRISNIKTDWAAKKLKQIVGNLGRFDSVKKLAAGVEPELAFVFRNAKQVDFVAQEVNHKKLIEDVKKYLKSNPNGVDWKKVRINDFGRKLLFEEGGEKYIGTTVAEWSKKLQPNKGKKLHWDKRIFINVPVKKAGVYLITAKIKDGNECKIALWLSDTTIVRKRMNGSWLYMASDSRTGKPLKGTKMNFFGYRQDNIHKKRVKKKKIKRDRKSTRLNSSH